MPNDVERFTQILAAGYFRYQKGSAHEVRKTAAATAKKPLDDVVPEGRVPPAAGSTTEEGGSR
jgi:hypothetical protein